MKHFNSKVSAELQAKLKEFADEAKDDFISEFADSEACSKVEELSGIAESGWIPLQLGGFIVSEYYRNDLDASYHFTKEQGEFNQSLYDVELERYKKFNDVEEIDYDDSEFQEWELDLFDPSYLRLTAFVDNDGMVKLELTINYKDAPYYRLSSDTMLKELTFTEAEFMKADFQEIFTQLKNF
jgi:hypothetical protein